MAEADEASRVGGRQRQRPAAEPADEAAAASPLPVVPLPPGIAGMGLVNRAALGQRFNTVGAIDGLLGTALFGWAYDRDFGRRRVKITMYIDGQFAAETTANGLRRELAGIGGHDGFSGFVCQIPRERFRPGASIRLFADGSELTAAPIVLGPGQVDGIVEPVPGAPVAGRVRERVLEPPRAVLDLYIDGRPARTVTADRLRAELKAHGIGDGCFGFSETLPDNCLDGGEHRIEFRHRASGGLIATGTSRFRATHVGMLERLDQDGGAGWVFCREAPNRPVSLDVIINGERIEIAADQARGDVRATHGAVACGFEFRIPDGVSRHGRIAVDIMVAGTINPAIAGPFTFTPVSRVIEELEAGAAKAAGEEGPRGA